MHAPPRRPVDRGHTEIQALPLGEANKLLASGSDQFEPVGTDLIKVIGQRFYRSKKHLGLDVNVKNARVEARAKEVCRCNNAISGVCGDRDCFRQRGVSDLVLPSPEVVER